MSQPNDPSLAAPSRGGCLCGAVRYRFPGEPLLTALCHCRHCQKQSGGAFSVIVGVPAATFAHTGDLGTYEDTGASGAPVLRQFCPTCGSAVLSRIAALPDLVLIKAGTLDDPSRLAPTVEVYCDSAMPFVTALAGAERYAKSNV